VRIEEGQRFGILETEASGKVISFEEKPARPKGTLGSMGIYVFDRDTLARVLTEDARLDESNTKHDFGRNIIPNLIGDKQVFAYNFQDRNRKKSKYWRDVGTLDAYYDANMDLIAIDPQFNLRQGMADTNARAFVPAGKNNLVPRARRTRRHGHQLDYFAGLDRQRRPCKEFDSLSGSAHQQLFKRGRLHLDKWR